MGDTRTAQLVRGAALVACAIAGIGCAIKKIPATTPPLSAVMHGERVLQVPTRAVYESVDTDRELTEPPADAADRAAQLDRRLRERLVAKGVSVVQVADLSPDARAEVDRNLADLRPRVLRLIGVGKNKEQFLPALAALGRATGAELACVPVFYAKVGKPGGYDGNSGAIWTTTSSTSVRVAVISLATGERVWFREAFMRSLAQEHDLDRAVGVLFEKE